jgi:Ca2+-binding RTX toxin-like protein
MSVAVRFRIALLVLVALAALTFPAPVVSAAQSCHGATPTIVGTSKMDFLFGTEGPDVIDAGAGNDFIQSRGGDDRICGRSGDDSMLGDEGSDILDGASGDDDLDGGDDLLFNDIDHAVCGSGFEATARVETNDGRCEEIFP